MKKNNFHLIGIGGIGMSGLARMLLSKKCKVYGSDQLKSETLKELSADGAHIYESESSKNIENSDSTVVYSTAIAQDHPELKQARELGCRIWHRSDLLAHLMHSSQSIAVTGTHGKTSTSALLSHSLIVAKKSPSFVIGGSLGAQKTNSGVGTGSYFVAEADESDLSFLKYFPNFAIVTNAEVDHLDHYKDFEEIKASFKQFASQVKERLFWCYDCQTLRELGLSGFSYGYKEGADIQIQNVVEKGFSSSFDLLFQGKCYSEIKLSMMGEHNILNASAVFALSIYLGASEDCIRSAFLSFQGVKRRAEKIGEFQEVQIYDDYAHHPTEITCLLKSFKKAFPKRRIIALFQPHRYSRLQALSKEFAASFQEATEVWLTDVFSAGEEPPQDFSILDFAGEIEKNSLVKALYLSKEKILDHFKESIRPFDVFITIGAGDITHFSRKAFEKIQKNPPKLKLGLLCGGISYEHYVSLISSKFILENASDLYDLSVYKRSTNGEWVFCDRDLNEQKTAELNDLSELDVALLVFHSREGEDGMIQGFLQTLKIPYSGASYGVSSLCMNKVWVKAIVESLGIKVPEGIFFNKEDWKKQPEALTKKILKTLSFPMVVKPSSIGSTLGVHFVGNKRELEAAILDVFELDDQVMVEERVYGRELEVSCLETEKGLVVTPPGEVKSDVRFYDYEAKYSKRPIEKVVKPKINPEISSTCQNLAKKIYSQIGIKSYARIDFFLTKDSEIIFAEVNTLPGMAPRSLFQRTLMVDKLSGEKIVDEMVIDALFQSYQENKKSFEIRKFLEKIKDVTH